MHRTMGTWASVSRHNQTEPSHHTKNYLSNLDNDQRNFAIAMKLNSLYKLLDLSTYDHEGVFHQSRYKQVRKKIEPAYVISPTSHMMRIQVHKVGKITILYLLIFNVWNLSVLHVVLCMLV